MNPSTPNEQKVLETEKELLEAMKNSDMEILDRLLHEDLLFVLPSGDVITKQMDLETHKSGNLTPRDLESQKVRHSLVSSDSFRGEKLRP